MNEQVVFGKFRIRLRKVETQLPPPATGTATTYVYPDLLSNPNVRYGVLGVHPQDDADVIVAVTGPQGVLSALANAEGVTALSEADAQRILSEWRI